MDHSLPSHLDERFRWLVSPEQTAHGPGEFVLYWMHNAIRAHENPALDVAICLARQNGLPLLVYHALSEDYPYASDRFHAFILQGQRDAQRELTDRGIRSHFHLQRDGDRGPHLKNLTRRAAVLVTEEMPVHPLVGWMERLVASTSTPIAMVDATCVVPVGLVGRAYTRAFEYRDATKHLYAERVDRPYEEQPIDVELFDDGLPFVSMNLQDACLSELIGQCRIDHTVAPVVDTPGGTRAGYARWNAFKQNRLADYEHRRNDAADHTGPSRMSAYLHFGMVSPLRIAREASQQNAEKYLDELLIWREMSFHFCYHHIDEIDSMDGLPSWARQSLSEHAGDRRTMDLSWETLARAKSNQPLWDACQRSLLKHGELHNNVRMTWGKALLPWTPSPGRAMQLTMDLNHRYALDGRDPNSYGGVLWCFGQFDRPFKPESEIYGRIRTRDPEQHLQRLDLGKYCRVVDRPITVDPPKVAVIGAGLGGLMAARTLSDHGLDVTVFDKSRGVGGRMATRRIRDLETPTGPTEISFDHGAQYFTARDGRFCRYVRSWIQDGIVEPWLGRIVELAPGGKILEEKMSTPRYVGVPWMNRVGKHLAKDLNVVLETPIDHVRHRDDGWDVIASDGELLGQFDNVIVNCPPPQASAIIGDQSVISQTIAAAKMKPTWALMICAEGLSLLEFDAAFINQGPLSWIARDNAKPKRQTPPGTSAWVLHASSEWSAANVDRDPADVQTELIAAMESASGATIGNITYATPHRWLYAIPEKPLDQECLWDKTTGIGACGDWCGGPRIEGAFLSGMAVAGALLRHLTIDRTWTTTQVS